MPHLSGLLIFTIKNIKQLCQSFHFAREAGNPVKTKQKTHTEKKKKKTSQVLNVSKESYLKKKKCRLTYSTGLPWKLAWYKPSKLTKTTITKLWMGILDSAQRTAVSSHLWCDHHHLYWWLWIIVRGWD